MSDLIAKGGRGHKAPYETTHARVPLQIKPLVEKLAAQWRKLFELGSDELTNGSSELLERVEAAIFQVTAPEAIAKRALRAIATPQDKPVNKIDYEATRDRYLASLRLGKQAPEYKRAKQHIDAFIKELEKAEARS